MLQTIREDKKVGNYENFRNIHHVNGRLRKIKGHIKRLRKVKFVKIAENPKNH